MFHYFLCFHYDIPLPLSLSLPPPPPPPPPLQRKVKAESVIEYVHNDIDTEEKDFFSLFFFVNNQKVITVEPLIMDTPNKGHNRIKNSL